MAPLLEHHSTVRDLIGDYSLSMGIFLMDVPTPTPFSTTASNICGSLSLACWVCLLLPQLIEQWSTKSADGIASGLLIAWLLGDFLNLFGAVYGRLRPNIIILGLWFVFSDLILLISYIYYSRQSKLRKLLASESEPLLERPSSPTPSEMPPSFLISAVVPFFLVVIIAWANFVLSSGMDQSDGSGRVDPVAQLAGYLSTAFYFLARIPQIIQNYRRKSTHGLSPVFFILGMLGNITYCLSILLYRHDKDWLIDYTSWLAGAILAVFEDLVILGQFLYYGD